MVYNYNYKRFKYSTAEKLNPKFWNPKSQRAKESKLFKGYPELNSRLDLIQSGIKIVFRRLLNDGIQPTNELLKKELEIEISDFIVQKNKLSLFEFIETFIEESKINKTIGTIKVYNTSFKYLNEFSQTKNRTIDFSNITLEFYKQFVNFLTYEKELSLNTVGKHIKTLKTFMNEATEIGLNDNLEFKNKKFKKTEEESDNIYLTIEELKRIEQLQDKPKLELTRDLFLIGCYTGLRFSDFTQIKPENIIESKSILQVRTFKTSDRVSVPLHPTVKAILKKYDNKLPKSYSNNIINKLVKEVCRLANLRDKIETSITRAGTVEKQTTVKYNLVSTHTARRSFATNCYLADIPSISIMKITGHKTEKSFLKYIKITQEENADKLLNHPFFN